VSYSKDNRILYIDYVGPWLWDIVVRTGSFRLILLLATEKTLAIV